MIAMALNSYLITPPCYKGKLLFVSCGFGNPEGFSRVGICTSLMVKNLKCLSYLGSYLNIPSAVIHRPLSPSTPQNFIFQMMGISDIL